MIISPTDLEVTDLEADAIVVGVDAQGTLTKEAQEVDAATGGLLARLLAQEEISGKLAKVAVILSPPGIKAGQVAVVGLGESRAIASPAASSAIDPRGKPVIQRFRPISSWSPPRASNGPRAPGSAPSGSRPRGSAGSSGSGAA